MTESAQAWKCSVCGYVHREGAPPDNCPVCGAPEEAFEPHKDTAPPSVAKSAKSWKCLNCGYIHEGDQPPDECPVCGAPADRFEPVEESAGVAAESREAGKVIVIGAGIAGISAVESLRSASPDAEITLISREADLPYYRLNLTRYLAGEIDRDDLPIHSAEWYEENLVNLMRESETVAISPDKFTVELRNGEKLSYDRLILAAGAHSFMPPFHGAYREGVTTLRTIEDADRILESARKGGRCVCIGGGVLGLEAAGALAKRGVEVTLLEGHGWLMPRQLNPEAGEMLRRHAVGLGIDFRMKSRTAEIIGDERARGVLLEDGDSIPADLVVVATGIRSNSYLARMAGLEVNQGVLVDNHLFTSDPKILAAGDIAKHKGVVYGIWGPAQYQGNIAGMNAAGLQAEFGGIPRSNTLKVLGLELFSIGCVMPEDGSYVVLDEETDDRYYRFLFRDEHLVGAILLGDASLTVEVKEAVEAKADFSAILDKHPKAADVREFLKSNTE